MAKNNLTIVFENDDFVAVNKPAGLLTIPDRAQSERSLRDILLAKYGSIFTVHRLDKDTSGLILFAKTEASHKFFSKLFEERNIEKFYLGIVHGQPPHQFGEIDAPIAEHSINKGMMTINRNGKPSRTTYEVLDAHAAYSVVSFQLHTGRTHQIRVHSKSIGHPLACDPLYGDGKPLMLSAIKKSFKLSKNEEAERPMISRLALHSYKLVFTDEHGIKMELIAEMPKEFRALMQQLNKLGT